MKLIAHRGNIDGPNLLNENNPEHIDNIILQGYDVEIDIRFDDDTKKFFLGHDYSKYLVNWSWLHKHKEKLWIHCKNYDALSKLIEIDRGGIYLNYFWHDTDDVIITSKGYMWANPGTYIEGSIAVLPEYKKDKIEGRLGVCSDYIINYEH